MRVLVDTSVWLLALRRGARSGNPAVDELRSLIDEGRVALIGPIRLELLSGIRTPEAFQRLRDHLRPSRSWKPKAGSWQPEAGSWQLAADRCQPVSIV